MEDRLANDIEELQNDPKWQRLLLEMISAHLDSCSARQKSPPPDDSPPHTPSRAELLDEEERMKNYRPPAAGSYNAAGSAVLSYRFNIRPDPLKASLMVHQYMDEMHLECPIVQSAAHYGAAPIEFTPKRPALLTSAGPTLLARAPFPESLSLRMAPSTLPPLMAFTRFRPKASCFGRRRCHSVPSSPPRHSLPAARSTPRANPASSSLLTLPEI
jgi:hypothetical protein